MNAPAPHVPAPPQPTGDIWSNIAQHRRDTVGGDGDAAAAEAHGKRELMSTVYVRKALERAQSYAAHLTQPLQHLLLMKPKEEDEDVIDQSRIDEINALRLLFEMPDVNDTTRTQSTNAGAPEVTHGRVTERLSSTETTTAISTHVAALSSDHSQDATQAPRPPVKKVPPPQPTMRDGYLLARSGLRLADTTLVDAQSVQKHNTRLGGGSSEHQPRSVSPSPPPRSASPSAVEHVEYGTLEDDDADLPPADPRLAEYGGLDAPAIEPAPRVKFASSMTRSGAEVWPNELSHNALSRHSTGSHEIGVSMSSDSGSELNVGVTIGAVAPSKDRHSSYQYPFPVATAGSTAALSMGTSAGVIVPTLGRAEASAPKPLIAAGGSSSDHATLGFPLVPVTSDAPLVPTVSLPVTGGDARAPLTGSKALQMDLIDVLVRELLNFLLLTVFDGGYV